LGLRPDLVRPGRAARDGPADRGVSSPAALSGAARCLIAQRWRAAGAPSNGLGVPVAYLLESGDAAGALDADRVVMARCRDAAPVRAVMVTCPTVRQLMREVTPGECYPPDNFWCRDRASAGDGDAVT
jgi:hypothetical protein